MPREVADPGQAPRWLARAREDLESARLLAGQSTANSATLAQQAAEKAVKAVYHHRSLDFERIHDINVLLLGLESAGIPIPAEVKRAGRLTQYAVVTRYDMMAAPVTDSQCADAIGLAQSVLTWAEGIITQGPGRKA